MNYFFNIIRSVCFDYWEFLTNFLTYFLTRLFDAVQNSSYYLTLFNKKILFRLSELRQQKQKLSRQVRDKEEELENSMTKIDSLRTDIRKAEKLRREIELRAEEATTGKFNQEPHDFKKFQFPAKKKVCIFRHLNKRCAKKRLAVLELFSKLSFSMKNLTQKRIGGNFELFKILV